MDTRQFQHLISGQRRGLTGRLMRALLRGAELPYSLYMRRRNRGFDSGRLPIHHAGVPVISVGNLTVGGTGKTPFVAWLARWYRQLGVRVAIISRGYGAQEGSRNDEALELEQQLPDVPHLQNPDRVEAAQTAIEELETQLIILDDAFQHRRIHRDLDIVLLDALEPFGYGHLLPRGLLREPISSLERAHVVVLSRSDAVSAERRQELRRQVQRIAPEALWVEVAHRPHGLLSAAGQQVSLADLAGQQVAAFCGIGNPAGFQHTLTSCGLQVAELRVFPDHHNYTREDMVELTNWANELSSVQALICTHKDLVKIDVPRIGHRPLWALTIAIEVREGLTEFEAKLRPLAPAPETPL